MAMQEKTQNEGSAPRPVWRAHRSIIDPAFCFDASNGNDKPQIVVDPTRVDLFNGKVTLIFTTDGYTVYKAAEPFPHDALRYFLIYQTRINYNAIYPEYISLPDVSST